MYHQEIREFRFGSEADISGTEIIVRYYLESGHDG